MQVHKCKGHSKDHSRARNSSRLRRRGQKSSRRSGGGGGVGKGDAPLNTIRSS